MLSVSDGWHYAALLHECIAIHTVEIQRQGFLACVLSHVWLFVTPWTITTRLLCPWDFPGKNTRVGCGFLLQGIFLTQRSNPCLLKLLHCRKILYPLNHQGSPSLSMGSLEVFSVLGLPHTLVMRDKKICGPGPLLLLVCLWMLLSFIKHCWLKKDAQQESFKLNFIWGKMRTMVWETAFQKALRNCSKEVGRGQYILDFEEGGVHTIKHIFLQKVSWGLLLVTRSRQHQEEIW